MSASLVGSEMCIRDRAKTLNGYAEIRRQGLQCLFALHFALECAAAAVACLVASSDVRVERTLPEH
eukprot:9445783-Alexandrium_andersonii.AAC.1